MEAKEIKAVADKAAKEAARLAKEAELATEREAKLAELGPQLETAVLAFMSEPTSEGRAKVSKLMGEYLKGARGKKGNGTYSRPRSGTLAVKVWETAEELQKHLRRAPRISEIVEALPDLNASTREINYRRWLRSVPR